MKRTLLLFLGLTLVATACGGDGEDEVSAAPTIVVEGAPDTAPVDDAGATETGGSADGTTGSGEDTASADETSGATDGAASTDASVTSDATDEELALAFANCMRDEGIDFPDPTVAADGSVSLLPPGSAANLPFEPGSPEFEAATDVCGELLQGASFLPSGDDDLTEIQDDLLDFAQCLRDLGFDVDDPDISGGPGALNPATLFGENFDPTDPANQDAVQECQSAVFGGAGPLGGGA
ncbi:MAG: hypothetical protein AAGA37_07230 [Actinomycetota bacterium]